MKSEVIPSFWTEYRKLSDDVRQRDMNVFLAKVLRKFVPEVLYDRSQSRLLNGEVLLTIVIASYFLVRISYLPETLQHRNECKCHDFRANVETEVETFLLDNWL